jgi:hypothetical protein
MAGSSVSDMLVAAKIITASSVEKPSISTSSWLSVLSLSSFELNF